MTAKYFMKNDTKQTLISLSLAGAIGYYLYNKLVRAGGGVCVAEDAYAATRRTEEELSWRPEPIAEEQPVVEEYIEPHQEPEYTQTEDLFVEQPVVEEQPVEEQQVVEEYVEEPVTEETPNLFSDPAVEETYTDESHVQESTPQEDFQMPTLGFVEQPVEPVEEVAQEIEDVVAPVGEEPVVNEYVEPVVEEQIAEEQPVANVLICSACGFENDTGCKFCNNCGTSLENKEPVNEVPVEEDATIITPTLDFGDIGIQLPNIEPVENIQPVEEQPANDIQPVSLDTMPAEPVVEQVSVEEIVTNPVEEDVSLDELENEEDTSVEDLFGAVNGTVNQSTQAQEPEKIMENTEQLHKVDQKSESSRQEFKSILDFFAANGLT